MTETTFPLNRNRFIATNEKLRIEIGGFHATLREEDVKDFATFLNTGLAREHKIVTLLIESINIKQQ